MVSVRFGILGMMAVSQLAAAVRLTEDVIEDIEDEQSDIATAGQKTGEENMCTSQVVEDSVRCGVDIIVEEVTDGLRCGFDWCEVPPLYLCAKTCEGEPVEKPRVCEILLSCAASITLHLKGQTSTTSISDISFSAELVDFEVTQDSEEVQQYIDANKATLLPWMQDYLDIGVPIANALLHTEISYFEQEVIGLLESDLVAQYAWIARLILGGKGFQEGMKQALDQRFSQVGAIVHRRYEVAANEEDSTKVKLCHRLLRVRTQSGAEFYISGWENALVARTTDLVTNCQTAYTAHCSTGSFVATTKCPLEAAKTTRRCLFSAFCWSSRRTIKPGDNTVVTMYRGQEEVATTEKVYVDHIKAPETTAASSNSVGVFSAASIPAVVAKQAAEANSDLAELDSLIQIQDEKLPEVMKDEVCRQLRANAWTGFKAMTEARCRLTFATLFMFASTSINIPLGVTNMLADVSLKNGVFRTEFIPPWELLSESADRAVKAQIDAEELPLEAKLESLNIQLSGDGDILYFEAWPTLSGVLNADRIQELRDLTLR